ncbi:MBL fold metallo-hydrolase [Azospirillum halopraeferens]|uniref:MBL fold metallo-hydrolase n=1 Tax=Azospirillum halopraeferens TaxID=34010 RepID=UPI000491CBDD|nr:MBL fold metallo-hydrolase [Azospirillum halopraeferens]
MRVTVLGCGGSAGVPVIGGQWGHCDPANPRNRRLRPSALVEAGGAALLIDTTPDLRQQLLDAGVRRLDGVLYTHQHADHCHGIDELREICRLMHGAIPAYGMAAHLEELKRRFAYCFDPLPAGHGFYRPVLEAVPVDGPFAVAGVPVLPILQDHGYTLTYGFRIGAFAYSTDVVRLDETAFAALEGIDTWIVDCTREEPHPVHAHLDLTLEWIARVRPRQAVLTHMNNSLDYDSLRRKLPAGVEPGYDGMVLEVPGL